MAAALHQAPAGRYDFTDRFGGLRGFRQKGVFRILRSRLYDPSKSDWITSTELVVEMYGDDTPHNRIAMFNTLMRMRRLGVPIETTDVPSGTPTAYRLRKPND